jgi:hypothetical protein
MALPGNVNVSPKVVGRVRRWSLVQAAVAVIVGVLMLGAAFARVDTDVTSAVVEPAARMNLAAGAYVALVLAVAAMLGRSALAGDGVVNPARAKWAWNWCVNATFVLFFAPAIIVVINAVTAARTHDILPLWGAVTSGMLAMFVLLLIRRGIAKTLRWIYAAVKTPAGGAVGGAAGPDK